MTFSRVMVFLASGLPADAGPTFDFLRTLLVSLPLSVHRRLKNFHLVHPTIKMRVTFTILGAALWGKLKFLDELAELREFFPPGKLMVPDEVVRIDEELKRRRHGGLPAPLLHPPAARLALPQPPPQHFSGHHGVAPSMPPPRTPPRAPPTPYGYAVPTPPPEQAVMLPPTPTREAPTPAVQAAALADMEDADEEVIWLSRGPLAPERSGTDPLRV